MRKSSLLLCYLLIFLQMPSEYFGRPSVAQEIPSEAQEISSTPDGIAGNEQVEAIMKTFSARGVQADDSQPTPAAQAVGEFEVQEGFEVDLVTSEPEVSQPLFLSWDSRGRMWVVQYRQYQYPAGLKVIRYDQYLRAVFDKVPEPPPHGVPGADKITVHEDTNGDGMYDSSKDVLTGLNIATAVQVGHGGMWVLNPPYLLFYPDEDGDDVPDRDPVVHLSGFGLQDTHSVANSLLLHPDGWIYGANGSTTAGTVSSAATKGVSFEGQCIWRYHPSSKVFEIYAEGGGNTFSLEVDSSGRIFSGTNGGNTRGYYYPQGSYSEKNWGKHGPLTNPYAFGYFSAMKMQGDPRRFAQAFLIYEGGLFPRSFDRTIIAPNSLHNIVWHSRLIEDGSTFQTHDEPNLLSSPDRWFRPVYCGVGPDGAVYIADWYDTRLSHVSPVDDWHKESGRVYRVRPRESSPKYLGGDLGQLSSSELVAMFDHPNKWVRQRAALELGWRSDAKSDADLIDVLVNKIEANGSLESLWAINSLDQLTISRAVNWLQHERADIRRWVVRLLGDRHQGHQALASLARTETDVHVRSQLASTAKRIDARNGLAIVSELAAHVGDQNDPHLPLLIWWAMEAHADDWDAIETVLGEASFWQQPLVRDGLVGRLMQRYATRGAEGDLQRCESLVRMAPNEDSQEILIASLDRAFQGRAIPPLPKVLDDAFVRYQSARGESALVLGLRSGQEDAVSKALAAIRGRSVDLGVRIELVRAFGEIRTTDAVGSLLDIATGKNADDPSIQRAAIVSLASYDDVRIATELVSAFAGRISREHSLRDTACRTLASRPDWASVLLKEINQWRLRPDEVPPDVVQQIRVYADPSLQVEVNRAFGKPLELLSPVKVAEIQRLSKVLGDSMAHASTNDTKVGKEIFMKRCGVCHKLFGEGESIGPPLDAYQRGDVKFWLAGIIEPSLEIREGYQSYLVITEDGRSLTGMIAAQDAKSITLRGADNRRAILSRDQILELKALPTSLMPEELLKDLSDGSLRELFAYLAKGTRS